MALENEEVQKDYVAFASQTVFEYPFRLLDASHIEVLVNDAVRSDFSVSGVGNENGGSITFNSGLTLNDLVSLRLRPPFTQTIHYQPNDKFPSNTHENALDKLTQLCLVNRDRMDRFVQVVDQAQKGIANVGAGVSSVVITLATAFSDTTYSINAVPRWNSNGFWITNKTTTGFTINFPASPDSPSTVEWRADNLNIVEVGTLVAPSFANGSIIFTSGPINLNQSPDFAWDNSSKTLVLGSTAKITMAGGVYTPDDNGDEDFSVLTTGSTKIAGSSQGLRKATWSFYDTKTNDIDNAVIKVDVLSDTNPGGTYKKTGIHIQQFSLPDNGGDTSGILVNQTGGGNAVSAFRFTSQRPAGKTNYENNGYALEVGMDNDTSAVLIHSGLQGFSPGTGTRPQGIILNMGTTTSKGIVIQPAESGAAFDTRIAIEIAQYTQGEVNANPKWQLNLTGEQVGTVASVGSYNFSGHQSILKRTANDASPYILYFVKDRLAGNLVNSDVLFQMEVQGRTGGSQKQIANQRVTLTDATGGSEDAAFTVSMMRAGSIADFFQLSVPGDGETGLVIIRNVGGAFSAQRVSMGAVDSGGAGFKLLRVPN